MVGTLNCSSSPPSTSAKRLAANTPTISNAAIKALQREGYIVIEAADPATALARIQRDPPAAVVLGIKPGRSDGLQILTRIHKLSRNCPVIVNATCFGCADGIMNRSPDTYYTDSRHPEGVKQERCFRRLLSVPGN